MEMLPIAMGAETSGAKMRPGTPAAEASATASVFAELFAQLASSGKISPELMDATTAEASAEGVQESALATLMEGLGVESSGDFQTLFCGEAVPADLLGRLQAQLARTLEKEGPSEAEDILEKLAGMLNLTGVQGATSKKVRAEGAADALPAGEGVPVSGKGNTVREVLESLKAASTAVSEGGVAGAGAGAAEGLQAVSAAGSTASAELPTTVAKGLEETSVGQTRSEGRPADALRTATQRTALGETLQKPVSEGEATPDAGEDLPEDLSAFKGGKGEKLAALLQNGGKLQGPEGTQAFARSEATAGVETGASASITGAGPSSSSAAPAQSSASGLFQLPTGQMVAESEIVDQVIGRFSFQRGGEAGTFKMNLYPEELGQVKVDLVFEKDGVKLHLQAQSQQVQEVLERHLPKLREAFEQQGVKLENVQVSSDSREEGRGAQAERDQHSAFGGEWKRGKGQSEGGSSIPLSVPVQVAGAAADAPLVHKSISLRV